MLGMQKQILTVTNREELVINEITKILGFDSDYILLEYDSGRITVEGEGLAIENLNKEGGNLQITGRIGAITFSNEKKHTHGIISKLLK